MFSFKSIDLNSSENSVVLFVTFLFICIVTYIISNKIIIKLISNLFKKTSTKIDDILIEKGFLKRLSNLIPLIVFYNLFNQFYGDYLIINRLTLALIAIVVILSINSLLNAFNEIYNQSKYSDKINIKSYFQIIRLVLNLLGLIIVISIFSGQSPFYLLSGLGALTAVLMLVFKDTILSFVSSIQISSNDLFKVGDWIEAPQFGADGDVIDIGLHTIKIQNWDKTISIIPTHKLIDSSFKNWRGMSDSGGRRIKRSIYIDMNSIKFCNHELIEKFKSINIISEYLTTKLSEIDSHNADLNTKSSINGRALTNIGTFRAYIKSYLRNNKNIHNDMTFLIRQLSPTEKGLPIEIYVFSNNTNWIEYEEIQSDIFDHLLSVISEFELQIYQYPSSSNLAIPS
tara:strand:- start:313 stop:1509 length:1197 start_codon:yes stop_codon:yes gene_type:complete